MKLTVYLFRDDVQDVTGLIPERYLEGDDPYRSIEPIAGLDFILAAYVQANKAKPPRWVDFLRSGFDLGGLGLANTSSSFIIFVRSSGRIFAFTFGYAYSAIDHGKIVQGFGLRVTLNAIRPSSINTVDTRSIDLVTRQSRIHLNVGSSIHEFEVNTSVDWLRYASGKPEDDKLGSQISGADSLQISTECTVNQLGEIADELLQLYSVTAYQERFPFVDSLAPVDRRDPEIAHLNAQLQSLLDQREATRLALALPEMPHPDTVRYKIFRRRDRHETVELDLGAVYQFLHDYPTDDALNEVFIIALDGDDQPRSQKRKLGDFLVCEVDRQDCRYVYSLGSWFRVARDFVAQARDQINSLPDLTGQLLLPPIRPGEYEGDYNRRVAEQRDWLCLDKTMFTFDRYTQRIEACDIATEDGLLIAVKKMHSSATLSHLFAQASVTARLLKTDRQYADAMCTKLRERWPDREFNLDALRFVYAIPTKKPGPLADCLFFFSVVNLIEHVQRIQLAGFGVNLCKITYEE